MTSREPVEVFVETGSKRVFGCALDWPGWARGARTEELALAALASYLPRYRPVVRRAGLAEPGPDFVVVERQAGTGGYTDFGVPGMIAAADHRPLTATGGQRLAALLTAAWAELEQTAAAAPAQLRKGPRGGGRDRDEILEHVIGAEAMFARKLGIRPGKPALADRPAVTAMRAAIVSKLSEPPADAAAAAQPGSWPPRYSARRIGWHVLDHAWEIEDKS